MKYVRLRYIILLFGMNIKGMDEHWGFSRLKTAYAIYISMRSTIEKKDLLNDK